MHQYIFLDKKKYQNNYLELKKFYKVDPVICLKNNAYGLGIKEITLFLDEVNCNKYFVSSVEEGIIVRENTTNSCEIYILQSLFPSKIKLYTEYNLIPTISSFSEIDMYMDFLQTHKFNIYFDTGLHGKGFLYNEVNNIINKLHEYNIPLKNIYIILSHLASGWRNDVENKFSDKNSTNLQHSRFLEIKNIFDTYNVNIIYSLCNTDGSRLGQDYYFNLPRVGRGIHGMSIYEDVFNIQQAFKVTGPITEIKKIKAGEKIGYGGFVTLNEDSYIGIVHIGVEKITHINFLFTNKIIYNNKEYDILVLFLDYMVINFKSHIPKYLDEVELIFKTRFTADM